MVVVVVVMMHMVSGTVGQRRQASWKSWHLKHATTEIAAEGRFQA